MADASRFDPPFVADREVYGSYSHRQLWELVHEALDPAALGEAAAAWQRQADAVAAAFRTFADTTHAEFERWSGHARAAAEPATAAFVERGAAAAEVCTRLRHLLEADAEAAQSIRDALPAPSNYVPLPDPVAEVVHGGARRMTHDIAAAAALADARDIMTFRYNTTLAASGDRVPRFVPAPRPDSGGGHP
ncbi:hypothetical protein C8258_22075 [Nocardia sp. MDA0666]|uniref:hypothetical protein n=1 Tax=Nocardia sp. MDA0666 TaxID=2135448 RepID=UPI000D12CA60|nr:hypothetical protein [Nocardia sp. MDA0666]PSR64391.1 hypothetical protein C8258_22075 [Nocardia sp. MDA0666]